MASPRNGVNVEASVNGSSKDNEIDREKVCPLLLRVFCANSRHNNLSDYNRGKVPPNELQIYTWMDASLRELTSLVREVNPESRKKGTYFDFSVISPQNGRGIPGPNGVFCHYASRDIGTTVSGTKGMDDNKTLAQARFVIGDYVDIAITPPNPGGGGRAHRLDRIGDHDSRDRDHRGGFGDGPRRGGGGFGDRGGGGGFGDRGDGGGGFGNRGRGGFGDRRRRPY